MSTEVVMPQMGESITEGTIVKWHKKPGERIDRDEPLFEITTDKVDTEVPAPAAGILKQIFVQEGETVAVGTVVATLDNGKTAETAAAAVEPKASAGHFRSSHEPKTFQRKAPPPQPIQAARHPAPAAPAAKEATEAGADEERGQKLSPAVISLANRHRLPIQLNLPMPCFALARLAGVFSILAKMPAVCPLRTRRSGHDAVDESVD